MIPKGKSVYDRWQKGHRLTRAEAMHAKCFECMGHYKDGVEDCKMPQCPLYPWMPYRSKKAA
jgi:hypothetical protein